MLSNVRRSLLLLVPLALVFAAGAPAASAAGLSVTPITWDVIGIKSNNTGLATGPNKFPVGVRVCNTSGGALTGVSTGFPPLD